MRSWATSRSGRALVALISNLRPDSVRPGDIFLHEKRDYSDRRIRFNQLINEFEMDYRSIRPYLLGLIVLICTGLIGLHGFWVGLYVTVVFEIVTGLCRSPGQSVINPITGEGTLYLYRMRSEPFTQSGFKVDLTHVRRLIPYSIPALMGVVTGVYTDIYRNPILVELTSIVIDCQGNCEIFYECTEYHSKMFVSSAHE